MLVVPGYTGPRCDKSNYFGFEILCNLRKLNIYK